VHHLLLPRRVAVPELRGKRRHGSVRSDRGATHRVAGALSERITAAAAIAPMLIEPDVRTTQVSQLLRGHAADVISREGFWLRVRSGDSYEGWIHQGYVKGVPDASRPLTTGWDDPDPLSLGCTVRDASGSTRKLPLGAILNTGEERTAGLAMTLEERRRTFPGTGDASPPARRPTSRARRTSGAE
jgi:hypothetical protein